MPRNPLVTHCEPLAELPPSLNHVFKSEKVPQHILRKARSELRKGTQSGYNDACKILRKYLDYEKHMLRNCAASLRNSELTLPETIYSLPSYFKIGPRSRFRFHVTGEFADTPDYVRKQLTGKRMRSGRQLGLA